MQMILKSSVRLLIIEWGWGWIHLPLMSLAKFWV